MTGVDERYLQDILAEYYRIENCSLEFLREGGTHTYIVNGETKYLLKVIGSAFSKTARQSVSIMRYLGENGFPVPEIILTKSGDAIFETEFDGEKKMIVLMSFVDGDEPELETCAAEVGELVGRFHQLMDKYSGEPVIHGKEFFIGRYLDFLRKKNYPRLAEYEELGERLWDKVKDLPQGNCHGDLHRGNLLQNPDGRIFLLDFDTACKAPVMFDVMVMCDMTDYFNLKQEDIELTKKVYQEFLSGYTGNRSLSREEILSFPYWVAIRHFQLQATILEIYGVDCIDEGFIDGQLYWLNKWQEALTEFITKKTGVRWEDVTVDGITIDDLDAESFKIFRREALRSKRMTEAELNISNEELLSKLKLLSNGKLKRSAVLLFYGDPSIVQVGSFVKVGKFANGTVEYHDDLEGSLISTADKVVDLIYLKYLKAKITYEHDRRVETYPFARNAIREAIYNAIAHNCYMYGTPIQIRIEEEQIIISNRCILPEGWTAETLMQPHDSIPYNPDIANVFYRAGYIETWGQGIQKICDECVALGAELPKYEIIGTGLRVYFPALKSALIDQPKAPKHQNTDKHGALDDAMVLRIIEKIKEQPDISQEALGESIGVTRRVVQKYINVLKESGRIERVGGKRYGHWKIND